VELPVNQPHVRVLGHIGVEYGSGLVPSGVAAAKVRRCLNSSFPCEYAVRVVCCVLKLYPPEIQSPA
jgi:hypothetical protein